MTVLIKRDITRLRRAMATVGTNGFFPSYLRLVRAKVPIATFLMIRFEPGRAPVVREAWFLPRAIPLASLAQYTETTYAFDPFYQHVDLPVGGGFFRISDIAPDRFFSSEYYLDYYRKTGLCDELGLLAPLEGGARAHLSISRSNTQGPFKRREIQCFQHHAPVLLELLTQHMTRQGPKHRAAPDGEPPTLAETIQTHARDALSTPLTRREAQVAALVLQGHSNGSAALRLDISRETCKVHRRNLYRKLSISSQSNLFGLLKHLL